MLDNQKCFDAIVGRYVPGLDQQRRCSRMPDVYDCMETELSERCGAKALAHFAERISAFGCSTSPSLVRKLDADAVNDDLAVIIPVSKQLNVMANDVENTRNRTRTIEILDGDIFVYNVSSDCDAPMQEKARQCVAPLMRTWISLRHQRPEIAELSFPLYKYSRQELLELCDGYANVFLCSGFDPIMKCLNDELVRFARDHLGYMCSPQNIERFMRHYDCIVDVDLRVDCNHFVRGLAEPGKDEKKCRGVGQYYECMRPIIERRCKPGALTELQESITEFGCRLPLV